MKYIALMISLLLLAAPAHALEVKEVKSKGGVIAWLIEDSSTPALTLNVLVRHAGSAYDPAGKEGRAALAVALLTEGAGERDAQAFHETLDFNAIRLGTGVSSDDLSISLTTLSEHSDTAFSLLHDMLAAPRFEAKDVKRIKAEQQASIRQSEGDANYQAGLGFNAALFPGHPYGKPGDGTFESVGALEQADIRDYAVMHLKRGGMILSVSGDITPEHLRELLETYVDTMPEGTAAASLPDVTPIWGERHDKAMEVPQTVVYFALPGVKRQDPDYYAAYIINYLLGGNGMSSKLGQEIREKRGLAYYANSNLVNYDKAALLMGSFATRSDQVELAITTLKNVIETVGKEGFTRQEFEEGVSYLTGSFPAKLTSNRGVVAYLESMQRHDLGRNYLDKRNSYLEAVTYEQVNELTKKLFKSENLQIMAVGKPAETAKNLHKTP